ncbi:MAG TPA: adenylate/guanylate cyclase domain-containing protein [Verrucomicrobiae bacterium]|jgi:adenylate cyclase|nr:adenylate/guanylate cyclase domain-containing protein [Verrucomicrobiae bacterium]
MDSVTRGPSTVRYAWNRHKGALFISLGVTLAALLIYVTTFIGERPTPLFDFINRLELNTLDTRFRLRGRARPDPRLIIVDIDQRSQEVLGRWPFSRVHFARMLDNLHEDGARVVAFDITFSKPEEPLRPFIEQLVERRQRGMPVSAQLLEEIARLEKLDNADQQFAESIQRFGRVIMGNYFLYSQSDLEGVSDATLDRYANLLAYFPYPQVRAVGSGGKQNYVQMIRNYEGLDLAPKGVEANTQLLTTALASDTAATGFFNIMTDPDGAVRRAFLALPYGRSPDRAQWDMYASLDVQTVRLYLGLPNDQTVLDFGPLGITSLEFGAGSVVHPDTVGRMVINYQGGVRTYPYVSIADVVNKNFPRGTFRDKVVLVGASATGIGDVKTTPFFGPDFPGVEVHANIIDNLLHQNFLQRGIKQELTDMGFITLFGIPLGIWLALVRPRWLASGLLLLVPFTTLVYWAFLHDWWLNFVTPSLFTLVPNVGLVALYRVLVEEKEKRKVRGAFQQYVSPAVIRLLLDNPEQIGPRKRTVSVMFTDIRDFTTLSENLDAQVLADLLNDYLTEMSKIVFRHRGTLDKYIGDAVMAFWGAPLEDPAHDTAYACNAALEMIARLHLLNQKWISQGFPSLDIGVGINTGIASVGNMGSALRYGYTAMGDAVNLASRLEALNKEYKTRIILSQSTRLALPKDAFLLRELDYIRVKGKAQPVEIYELLGRRGMTEDLEGLAERFAEGREAYKLRDWRHAVQLFDKVLERWPNDGPALIFRDRAVGYLAEPPASDWDGVHVMKYK